MNHLSERWKAPTPKFWRKMRNFMVTIGSISGALIASQNYLPDPVVYVAGYGLAIGIAGTCMSQLTSVKH